MKPELIRCDLSDLNTLVNISRKTYLQYYQYLWHDQGRLYMQEEFNRQTLMDQMQLDHSAFYLVQLSKQIIGYLKLNYHRGISHFPPEECLEIQRIYLMANQTGKGLGSDVLEQIETIADDLGLSLLWLQVMEHSLAKSFYLRNGYQVIGSTQLDHPQIKREYQSIQVMTKLLT